MSCTIRHLAGIAPADVIDAATTALLLIDFQNEYFDGRLSIPDGPAALHHAVQLVHHADRHGMPVFHVQHIGAAGAALFADDSRFVAIHPSLAPAPHHQLVRKRMVSSFAGTDLHARLRARGIVTLIVAGLMTHMCVSTAVRDARQFGNDSYRVLVAADACATRDIDGWNGGVMAHRTLHDATLTALSDNFADVLTTAAILALTVKGLIMPILKVILSSTPDAAQSARIAATLTQLTESLLHKDAALTSVAISHQPAAHWFIGATSLPELARTSFFLDILVTDETNTASEKAAYIAAVYAAMSELLGQLHPVSYIHVHDARAAAWGYGGQTQQYRAIKKVLLATPA